MAQDLTEEQAQLLAAHVQQYYPTSLVSVRYSSPDDYEMAWRRIPELQALVSKDGIDDYARDHSGFYVVAQHADGSFSVWGGDNLPDYAPQDVNQVSKEYVAEHLRSKVIGFHCYARTKDGKIQSLGHILDAHNNHYDPDALTVAALQRLAGLTHHDKAYIRLVIEDRYRDEGDGSLPDDDEGAEVWQLLDALDAVPELTDEEWDAQWEDA